MSATGNTRLSNGGIGIDIEAGSTNTRIGTDGNGIADQDERNIVSGNGQFGINVQTRNWDGTPFQGGVTTGTIIAGNLVGTDASGTIALPNVWHGISVWQGAQNTRIGTDGNGMGDAAERNIISGNGLNNVSIVGIGTDHNVIAGNFIGTDITGTFALKGDTGQVGVVLDGGAKWNRIGTDGGLNATFERNVISGNLGNGIRIVGDGTDSTVVAGNYLGTNSAGTAAIVNGGNVVVAYGAENTVIGTNGDGIDDATEGNLICGAVAENVMIDGVGTDNTVVAGNFIGTDLTGMFDMPGDQSNAGVAVRFAPKRTRIGTNGDGVSDTSERNIISGNGGNGIAIQTLQWDGTSPPVGQITAQTVVAGNYIGTNVLGTNPIPNWGGGVVIGFGAANNRIGTDGNGVSDVAERNLISGNLGSGINIFGDGTDGNVVAGNYLGTNAAGTAAIINNGANVAVYYGAKNTVVGTNGDGIGDAAEGNLISGAFYENVLIHSVGTDNTVIAGNLIGTDFSGMVDMPGDHSNYGVSVRFGARNTRIGTNGNDISDALERNVISGNGANAILRR